MSDAATLIERLIASGTPAHLVAEVAMLQGEIRALERIATDRPKTQTKGAARTERWRARQAERASQNVTSDADVTNVTPETSHVTVGDVSPSPSPSPNEILNPNPAPTRVRDTRTHEASPDLPDGASAEQWRGFVEMRRRIRKPMTPRAEELALRKLHRLADDGQPPGAVLDQSILNSWQDLYPLKDHRNGLRPHNDQGNRTSSHPGGRDCAAADIVFGGVAR